MSIVSHAPHLTPAQATAIARDCFGVGGAAAPLPSERDQNFWIAGGPGGTVGRDGPVVLKIANALEEHALLEAQNEAMLRVAAESGSTLCPLPLPALDGSTIVAVTAPDGRRHWVRLLTWLQGKPLAAVKPHDTALLTDLGGFLGRLDAALAGFDHAALHRRFHWDVTQAATVIDQYKGEIADAPRRAVVERLLRRFVEETAPKLPALRHAAIHADANDYNVLVEGRRVAGILDFGDMIYSVLAAEPAVAAAYALLDKPDPLAAIAAVTAGYHGAYPLQEEEIAALFDLVCMRLCMSVCHAAHQRRQQPGNDYLSISEQPAWEALERLAAIHPRLAHYTLRAACGLPPVPHSERIAAYLRRTVCAPVIDANLRHAPPPVLDLSVGSPLLQSRDLAVPSAGPLSLADRFAAAAPGGAGTPFAIGRYDEARALYTGPRLGGEGRPASPQGERRTIHLGLDLFAPAGTPVYAPLAGVVHALAPSMTPGMAPGLAASIAAGDCAVVVLRHSTEEGTPFFTLYRHLAAASLAPLQVGEGVAAGAHLGAVAPQAGGSDWPAHVHVQLVADLLELDEGFPALAAPAERAVYRSLCPDPNLLLGIPAAAFPPPPPDKEATLAERRRRIGYNLSISYRQPLKIVRGLGVYLYDDEGRPYLDCVNNVAHVGHCHPHVVAAGQRQMGVLNTNTRYLHDYINDYARRLAATLPEPLSVCFFVNSGSEANDLALRLARTATGEVDLITLDVAYHGHTQALIEVSPYKHAGPGGKGAPPYVQTVVMPDPYRGPYRGYGAESGRAYAGHVQAAVERVQAGGRGVAGFICESLMGCGGQIVLPDGFMASAFAHVRAAGGICIADEVQTGLGRVGSHFWGFETQGVVPDIVTVGKPAGNGHPLAAVITTPEIARKFANGMEYFNTFGGNPVSCAVGLAVLDVIEAEGLQANALDVGDYLMARLRELAQEHPLIGDVRGLGLYIGAELVLDRETRTPAGEHAAYIADRMRDLGVLISTDGPDHNVLKIKPPIVFSRADADRLAGSLALVLQDDALQL